MSLVSAIYFEHVEAGCGAYHTVATSAKQRKDLGVGKKEERYETASAGANADEKRGYVVLCQNCVFDSRASCGTRQGYWRLMWNVMCCVVATVCAIGERAELLLVAWSRFVKDI